MVYRHYPQILHLGHPLLTGLFEGEVLIEEKIDGSQFNFGIDAEGHPWYRSKGSELYADTADKLFKPAIQTVNNIANLLKPGQFYRGETLCRPKHNTLAYDRVPKGHIILFDIDDGNGNFWGWEEKQWAADELGIEVVPRLLRDNVIHLQEVLDRLLTTGSVLGGTPIEGVVIKNYHQFGHDGKPLFGKFVSERFKEQHTVNWKQQHPGANDIIMTLTNAYRHDNRWLKSVQHLRDQGVLTQTPQDIGALMQAIPADVKAEAYDEIVRVLWAWAWPKIRRGIVRGFPEFYKQYLADTVNR